MKLTEAQKNALSKLASPRLYGNPHAKNAFNERTINALEDRNLVRVYNFRSYLHGAVKLTKQGEELLKSL